MSCETLCISINTLGNTRKPLPCAAPAFRGAPPRSVPRAGNHPRDRGRSAQGLAGPMHRSPRIGPAGHATGRGTLPSRPVVPNSPTEAAAANGHSPNTPDRPGPGQRMPPGNAAPVRCCDRQARALCRRAAWPPASAPRRGRRDTRAARRSNGGAHALRAPRLGATRHGPAWLACAPGLRKPGAPGVNITTVASRQGVETAAARTPRGLRHEKTAAPRRNGGPC